MLVLSHRDTDHVGGAAALLQAVPVGELRSSLEPGHALLQLAAVAPRCEAGQAWQWDGVRFELLHPLPAHYDAKLRPNDLSCVLRITSAGGRRALLLGDLEAAQERALVQREAELHVDVLLVPHHGSKTSSSAELLAAVRPAVGLVQAGYRSRFGHPAPPVLARYQAAGIAVVASPSCGAWRWRSDRPPGEGSCERTLHRRYWSDRVAPPVDTPEPTGPDMADGL
jgi:competence protein ComEC